ncbi:MAG TPA: hypothetical protein VKX24_12240, partial [Acidimicrobiia bacterium]|nr:hypothetical protein [Acidimicrobiia bacterium]
MLAVGLDAAEPAYLASLLDRGRLPNLLRLRTAGTWHELRTEPPWRQGFTYNQVLAGRAPSAGDAWDVCRFDPRRYRAFKPVAGGQLGGPPFYERVAGMRTIVFDFPWSAIGSAADVVEVVAWGAHSPHYPRASRPRGLLREIDRRVGVHPGFKNSWSAQWHDRDSLDRMVEASVVGARRRAEAMAILQAGYPDWELSLVMMSETHDAGELLWHGADPDHPLAQAVDAGHAAACLEAIYRGVDDAVGRMVAKCPPDTAVVVFSLFGSCSGPGDAPSTVLLPELLTRASGAPARLRPTGGETWKRAGCPPVVPARSEGWQEVVDRAWTDSGRPAAPAAAEGGEGRWGPTRPGALGL